MPLSVATWNINSFRLRQGHVCRFLDEVRPDVLCLQECKSPVEKLPLARIAEMGWPHVVARGQKGYNGVAILSKRPIEEVSAHDHAGLGHARHVSARLRDGTLIENYYVPAGGDEPDRQTNPKFGQKLDYVAAMADAFRAEPPHRAILVGDLNIAPREDDVWSHKRLLRVVSHTPVEVRALNAARAAGDWVDVPRRFVPEGRLYTWWSYRNPNWRDNDKGRRLDHIWASPDVAALARSFRVHEDVRGWDGPSDHVPVIVEFDL